MERDQSAPAQTAPQQAGFGSQTERLFFFLGKPRTKGSRFALACLIVKYGYYITGRVVCQDSSTIARREQDAPPPNSHHTAVIYTGKHVCRYLYIAECLPSPLRKTHMVQQFERDRHTKTLKNV